MNVAPGPTERRRVWHAIHDSEFLAGRPEPPDVPPCTAFTASGFGPAAFFCDRCWWTREDHWPENRAQYLVPADRSAHDEVSTRALCTGASVLVLVTLLAASLIWLLVR